MGNPIVPLYLTEACDLALKYDGVSLYLDGDTLKARGGVPVQGLYQQQIADISGIQSLPPSIGTAISGSGITFNIPNLSSDHSALVLLWNVNTVIDGDDYTVQPSLFEAAINVSGSILAQFRGPILPYNGSFDTWCTPSFDGLAIGVIPPGGTHVYNCVVYIGHPSGTWRKTGGHIHMAALVLTMA